MENTEETNNNTSLLVDEPISIPAQDRLNRIQFAEHLANVFLEHEGGNCIIASLNGEWGCGKSSILNLIEGYLIDKQNNGEDIIILRFEPWNASDVEQLTAMFFRELKLSIIGVDKNKTTKANIGKLLDIFSGILTIAQLSPIGNQYFSMGSALTKKAGGMLKDTPSKTQEEIKKQLDKILEEYAKRIFIIMDDIDRLDIDAMKLLFRLIRNNANFKNTTYLLAFDRNLVEDVLECEQPGHGKEYIDKIVQVPIDVPSPDEGIITNILIAELDTLVNNWGEEGFDRPHWEKLYPEGRFRAYFKNIRKIVRYINGLEITYPLVSSEVDMVDFMALNLIRTFAPLSYEMIRKNKDILTKGKTGASIGQTSVELTKEIMNRIYNIPSMIEGREKEAEKERDLTSLVESTCRALFPTISSIMGGYSYSYSYSGGGEEEWRQKKRICSQDYFDKYFMLGTPIHDISDEEIRVFIASTEDIDAFNKKLIEYFDRKKGKRLLEKIEDYISHVNEEHIEGVVIALFNAEDKIVAEPRFMMMMNADLSVVRIVHLLLGRIQELENRKQTLLNAIEKCNKVYLPVHFVSFLTPRAKGGDDEESKKEMLGFSVSDLREIQEKCLDRIKLFVREGILSKVPNLDAVLYRWKEWENIEEAKKYVEKLIVTDEGLWDFLAGFTNEVLSSAGNYKTIQLNYVREFTDFESAEKRIKSIVTEHSDTLTEKQKEIVDALENGKRKDLP